MRTTELTGYHSAFEQLSPDVIRAQRQAELKDMLEYNLRHLQAYKDWSDPEKRAKKIRDARREEAFARSLVSKKAEDFAIDFDLQDKKQLGDVKPVLQHPKPKWWERILAWFDALFH